MGAEHLFKKVLVDIGFQEEVFAEGQSVTFYLLARHAQGRNKLPQQAVHGMHRYLPDTEETKDMVYAISIEVFRHFTEAFHPPCITVFLHYIPIIGRESPVLSVHREIIGRRTGLTVQVEVMRLFPCLHTVAADADGNIAFQHHPIGTRMFGGSKQLQVQIKLYIIIDSDVRIVGSFRPAQCLYLCSIISAITRPLTEVRSLVSIAQITENSIRTKPFLISLIKVAEGIRSQYFFSLLLEYETEIVPFRFIDRLVVYSGQGIQLFPAFFEFGHLLFIFQLSQLFQVGVHGMESIDRDAVIRIRVCPSMRHGGVVDGQNLYSLLVSGYRPINHTLQITEVAYTKALFRTKGEYGHGHPRTFPGRKIEIHVTIADNQCFIGFHLRISHIAIRIILPSHYTTFFLIV